MALAGGLEGAMKGGSERFPEPQEVSGRSQSKAGSEPHFIDEETKPCRPGSTSPGYTDGAAGQGWVGSNAGLEPLTLPASPGVQNLDPGPSLAERRESESSLAATSLREAAGPLVLSRTGAGQEISHH